MMVMAAMAAVTAFAGKIDMVPDSIPCLVEHARWQEPWAYEALGDCYRYGSGGVEKCMISACICYEAAGRNVRSMAEEALVADPTDEFGLINRIMEGLMDGKLDNEEALGLIGRLPSPKPAWALSVERILTDDTATMRDFFDSILSTDMTGDEMMVGMALMRLDDSGWSLDRAFDTDPDSFIMKMEKMCVKIPPLFDPIGGKLWDDSRVDSPRSAKIRTAALGFMHEADRHGLLSKRNMARILDYIESDTSAAADIPFIAADIARFNELCPRSYRDTLSSRCIELDPADSPVSRIEE